MQTIMVWSDPLDPLAWNAPLAIPATPHGNFHGSMRTHVVSTPHASRCAACCQRASTLSCARTKSQTHPTTEWTDISCMI